MLNGVYLNQPSYICPLVFGKSVYLARSLYSLFSEDNSFDDEAICDGYYKKEKPIQINNDLISVPILFVYPNPASNTTKLNFFVPQTVMGDVYVSMVNLQGETLMLFTLPKSSSTKVLDLSQFAAGVYFARLHIDHTIVTTQKLTVIK